jgi:hypothetical protein
VHLSELHPRITDLHLVTSLNRNGTNVRRVLATVNGGPPHSMAVPDQKHSQYVIGRFSIASDHTDNDGAQQELVIIDTDDHTLLAAYPVTTGNGLVFGWDGRFNSIPKKYPWLTDLAEQRDSSGTYHDPGESVGWATGPAQSFTFYAQLPRDAIPVNGPNPRLLAAIFEVGPNGQPWDAARLPLAAPHLTTHEIYFGN